MKKAHVTFNYRGREAVVVIRMHLSEAGRYGVAHAIGMMLSAYFLDSSRSLLALCAIVESGRGADAQTSWTFDLSELSDVQLEKAERAMRGIGPDGTDHTARIGHYYRTFAVIR